jgi:hypothetical protein
MGSLELHKGKGKKGVCFYHVRDILRDGELGNCHQASGTCYRGLDHDPEKMSAHLHHDILAALGMEKIIKPYPGLARSTLQSMLESREGRTPEFAWSVHQVEESLLHLLEVTREAIRDADAHKEQEASPAVKSVLKRDNNAHERQNAPARSSERRRSQKESVSFAGSNAFQAQPAPFEASYQYDESYSEQEEFDAEYDDFYDES